MSEIDEMVKEYGYTNFKVLKDEWSEYILEDKTIIRIKTIPLKIIIQDSKYGVNTTIALAAFSPKELKGEPSDKKVDNSQAINSFDKADLTFEPKKEPWNEYELEDGTKLFLKTIAVQVSRTKLFDLYGDPIYWVNHQLISKKYPI